MDKNEAEIIEQDLAACVKQLYSKYGLTHEEIHGLVDLAMDEAEQIDKGLKS